VWFTVQGMGSTDEIDAEELGILEHSLTAALAAIELPAVEFRCLTVEREAVYLKAHPATLFPLGRTIYGAVLSVLGVDRFSEVVPDQAEFLPHVSIGYVNRERRETERGSSNRLGN
jgi:hypothetical protein